jgi:hypothetical protein
MARAKKMSFKGFDGFNIGTGLRTRGVLWCCSLLLALAAACGGPGPGGESETGDGAQLLEVALAPELPRQALGTSQRLRLLGRFSDGTRRDLSAAARWQVQDRGGRARPLAAPGLLVADEPGRLSVRAEIDGRAAVIPIEVSLATLTSIAVSPRTPTLALGSELQFTATGKFSDGSSQDVTPSATWSIADVAGSGVATVDGRGVVRARSLGQARITARYLGKSSWTTLEVTAATLVKIQISPSSLTLPKGASSQLTATALLSDGTVQPVGPGLGWSIRDTAGTGVAVIDADGVVTGKALGRAEVTASYFGKSASAPVEVIAAALRSLSIEPYSKVLPVGRTTKLAAIASYTDGARVDVSAAALWKIESSTGTPIALSSNGEVSALAVGSARISASALESTAWAVVEVRAFVLDDIRVSPTAVLLNPGRLQKIAVTALYSDGKSSDVTASSSFSIRDVRGTGVVSIGAPGEITARAPGRAEVVVEYDGYRIVVRVEVESPWARVSTPGWPTPQLFTGVWARSRDEAWITSYTGKVFRWDGRALTEYPMPSTRPLRAITGNAAGEIWAVGEGGACARFDGTAFRDVPTTWGAGVYGRSVASPAAGELWVMTGGRPMHFDGTSWSTPPALAAWSLGSVWYAGGGRLWLVGHDAKVAHLVGGVFSTGTLITPTTLAPEPLAVWGTSDSDVWAGGVGPRLFHFDGTAWTPTMKRFSDVTLAIWGAAGDQVWATGEPEGWATGAPPVIHRWDGQAWFATPAPVPLRGLHGAGDTVYAVGEGSTLLRLRR